MRGLRSLLHCDGQSGYKGCSEVVAELCCQARCCTGVSVNPHNQRPGSHLQWQTHSKSGVHTPRKSRCNRQKHTPERYHGPKGYLQARQSTMFLTGVLAHPQSLYLIPAHSASSSLLLRSSCAILTFLSNVSSLLPNQVRASHLYVRDATLTSWVRPYLLLQIGLVAFC